MHKHFITQWINISHYIKKKKSFYLTEVRGNPFSVSCSTKIQCVVPLLTAWYHQNCPQV